MRKNNYIKTNTSSAGGGIGVCGVLQIIFIVLKLLHIINWSWWVVFIPLFISLGLALIAVFIAFVFCWTVRKQG